MLSLLALFACGDAVDGDKGDGPFPTDPALTEGLPTLALETPPAASFLSAGANAVSGRAVQVTDVTVNDEAGAMGVGRFDVNLALPVGMTTLVARGAGPDGVQLEDSWSVLAGIFAPANGTVSEAVRLHVAAEAFESLPDLVGDLLDPAALDSILQSGNPIVDTATASVNLTGVTFDPPQITLIPGNGLIDIEVVIPAFVLGIEATVYDALPFGIDLTLNPDLTAEAIVLTTTLDLDPDGFGGLDATVGPLTVDLVEMNLDTGILELVDWLFINDEDLAVLIEAQVAALGGAIEPLIDGMLDDLPTSIETALLGAQVAVAASFDGVTIDPSGVALTVGMAMDVAAPDKGVPGHLMLAAPPPRAFGEVSVQLSDAFMNRALFELWAGGTLDMVLPLDATTLFLFGGKGSGTLSLSSALPPVWLERDGVARLQLGEAALTVDTPGGEFGERIELVMALDARADLVISPDAAGIILSGASVKMRAVGDSASNQALIDFLPGLENAFGIGIGVVNEQLSFPLADLGLALPAIAFERDPSGLGTAFTLTIDDVLGLLSPPAATTTTTTTTTIPAGDITIPSTAVVSTGDEEAPDDGLEVWICDRDDIDASGDNGTWYVDDNGGITVTGTGHVIYAVDNADVTLDAPGNTVYADPGANIDDNDGTNTIIVVDPLTFDLSSAPTPGC